MSKTIKISVSQPASDNMGASIKVLFDVLSETQPVENNDTIDLDIGNLTFVHPFLILPIASFIHDLQKKNIKVEIVFPNYSTCKDYLGLIYFFKGLNPLIDADWENKLNSYNSKTYLPIISVPVRITNEVIKNKVLSVFEQIMQKQLNLDPKVYYAIKYIISEAFDNIDQHADIDNGWLMVQNYPTKDYMDVCIADTGKGILKSYQDVGFTEIKTHEAALQEAINGKSAKIHEKSRGFGISTSRRMLVKGLKGKYFLFTGNAFYIWTDDHENILDAKCNWQGTMLALRIPKKAPDDFNYINYLE